ncbi:MAG TPA: hypothetical protein PKO06_18435, partial [Candidatus Ozemobacteraceae bacterium]|nr:hypothetical protein [Candidatus Ozemobacteraceae bacterium]
MNWIRRHPFITLFGLLGLLTLFLGFELLSTLEDLKLMMDVMNGKVSLPSLTTARGKSRPPRYSLKLLATFSIPLSLADEAGTKAGGTWDHSRPLFPSNSSAGDVYAKIASETPLAIKIAEHLTQSLNHLPTCASLPALLDFGASTANYREVRTHARFLVFLAR